VIAISLNRIIAGGEQILVADSMADKSKLQEIIERKLAANRWRWWTRIRFDQSCTRAETMSQPSQQNSTSWYRGPERLPAT